MGSFDHGAALLLAASEAAPAEWRDLSDLLEACAQDGRTLSGCLGNESGSDLARYIASALTQDQIRNWEHRLDLLSHEHPDVWMTSVGQSDYPANLAAAYDRPPFLFVKGTLTPSDSRSIAIVGSRECGDEALRHTRILAEEAARAQIVVVAGLARGVDAIAHRGALRTGGRTLAVLGTGIDRMYPPEHHALAAEIAGQGALLSQFRPGTPGTKSSFPLRNTVISGLSLISVVMEAGERSGTRSEAEAAIRQGRRVFLWQPSLGEKAWAARWVSSGQVEWATSTDDVLNATLTAASS